MGKLIALKEYWYYNSEQSLSLATASYRLMPEIILKEPVTGKQAKKLAKCFPEGVIGIKEIKGNFPHLYSQGRCLNCIF